MIHKKLGTVVDSGNGNKATEGQVSGDLFVTFFTYIIFVLFSVCSCITNTS